MQPIEGAGQAHGLVASRLVADGAEEVARFRAARGEDLVVREERLRRLAVRLWDEDVTVAAVRLVAHALEDDGVELPRLPDDPVRGHHERQLVGLELDARPAARARVSADGGEPRDSAALRRRADARRQSDEHDAEDDFFTHGDLKLRPTKIFDGEAYGRRL